MDFQQARQSASEHYKNGNYSAAIKILDQSIKRAAPEVALLDLRAACRVGLDDLPGALKDAKQMVQLSQADPTGYLRAGKVLEKMGKSNTALEIWALGLKRVKHVGLGYTTLRKLHDDLTDEVWPHKNIDPLTAFPREIALLMLENLTFAQRVSACRVSKQWKRFILSEPGLWQDLDLSCGRSNRIVKTVFISSCINAAKKNIRFVHLRNLADAEKTLTALTRHCPLERMTLDELGLPTERLIHLLRPVTRLRELKVLGELTRDPDKVFALTQSCRNSLELFQSRCRSLEFVKMGQIPNLRTLNLTTSRGILDHLNTIPHFAPLLQSLVITEATSFTVITPMYSIDLSSCSQLEHLDLHARLRIADSLKLPPSLRKLRLYSQTSSTKLSNNYEIPQPGFYLPHLVELELHIPSLTVDAVIFTFDMLIPCSLREETTIPQVAGRTSNVSRLTISHAQSSLMTYLRPSRFDQLEYLSLESAEGFHDEQLEHILKRFPLLRFLNLSATEISGLGVQEIVNAGHVKELVINDCRLVSFDAVDWARSQGVKVSHQFTNDVKSWKKVR